MGLYVVTCPQCKTAHQWFSGNRDQRCSKCVNSPISSTSSKPAGENILAVKDFSSIKEASQANTPPTVSTKDPYSGPYLKVKHVDFGYSFINTDNIYYIDFCTEESHGPNYVGACIVRFGYMSYLAIDKESTDKLVAFLGLENV